MLSGGVGIGIINSLMGWKKRQQYYIMIHAVIFTVPFNPNLCLHVKKKII